MIRPHLTINRGRLILSLLSGRLVKQSHVAVPTTCIHTGSPQNDKQKPVSSSPPSSNPELNKKLMEFFDDPKNWGEIDVKTGRSWRKEELRLKSNEDLHKLWFVLYKERNMLMTMMLAYDRETQLMPSPERLDKVEESMKNLQDVVRERNQVYWDLEVGHGTTGERPYIFRRDQFGRYRSHKMSEHIIPYRINAQWRFMNAPGHGESVRNFQNWYKSKLWGEQRFKTLSDMYRLRQMTRRFPQVDREYLKELYPKVPFDLLDSDKLPEMGRAKEPRNLQLSKRNLTRRAP